MTMDIALILFTAALGLAVVIAYFIAFRTTSEEKNAKTSKSANTSGYTEIPGWDRKPADPENGDLDEINKHGSLHQYLLHLHQNGHQPINTFWWGQERLVSVCSTELIKDAAKLTNTPKQLFSLFEPITGPLSIMYANGQEWEDRRKWIYDSLKGSILESYIPIFTKIADEAVSRWSKFGNDNMVDLQEEILTMTLKGITRTCYGSIFNDEEEVRSMSHIYQKIWSEMEQIMLVGPPEPGSEREKLFNDYSQQMKDTVQRVITKRQSGEEEETIPFIDNLLQSGAPDEQIIADGITFMLGGLHTSGYLMLWTIHYLTLNKDVYHKLLEEMRDRVGSDQGDKLKSYIYDQNTLLRQVLNEVLRLTVLGPFAGRYSDDDVVIGDYLVPAGTTIVIALGVALNNETVWKNAEKFDHTQCSHLQGKDLMAFAPFGHGRRKCPGYHFTYVEVGVFLTIVLQQFTIEPVGEVKDVEKVYGLVTVPKEPLKFYVSLNK